MTISDQILHPGGVEMMKAPLPAGLSDTPETRQALQLLVSAPSPVVSEPATPSVPATVVVEEPAQTTTGAVIDTCTDAASSAWDLTKCAGRLLNGVRTLLFFAVTGALAFGAKLGDVDISGFISRLTGANVDSSDIVVFMSLSGIVLRWLTTTEVFARWKTAAKGAIQSDSSSNVDDPDSQ